MRFETARNSVQTIVDKYTSIPNKKHRITGFFALYTPVVWFLRSTTLFAIEPTTQYLKKNVVPEWTGDIGVGASYITVLWILTGIPAAMIASAGLVYPEKAIKFDKWLGQKRQSLVKWSKEATFPGRNLPGM